MTHQPSVPVRPTQERRGEIVRLLGEHFAHDHLTVEELESRIERAYKANQLEQLEALTADLPSLAAPRAASVGEEAPALPVERVPRRNIFAIMGGVVRKGVWAVPRRLQVLAIMGGVELDLREAELGAGVTEIKVLAIMGGVEIRVPSGVRLEAHGVAIMGGFEDQLHEPVVARAGAPVVRVTGVTVIGGVVTKVVASSAERGAR